MVAVSLAQRFERRLESLVGGAFARVFKGQVEPVEIGTALQREATDKRNVMGNGHIFAPNRYRVTLGPSDYERLVPWEVQLTNSLAELVQEHLDDNGWTTIGDIEVYLARDDHLHTGVFGVASRMEAKAPPRKRPHDSLSFPVMPGQRPGDYSNPVMSGPPPPAEFAPARPAADPAGFVPGFEPPPIGPAAAAAQGRPPTPKPPPRWTPTPQYPQQHRRVGAAVDVDGTNRRLDLRVGSNLIGRGSEADLQLLDQGISRRHIDIQFDGNFATVYDLGSTNGTSVNGRWVGSQLLRHGDVIKVGNTKLVYRQSQS
jgi:hypothetical protein